ncbi:MAG: fibro-slime domain-containing protein [Phycisphaerales bacterium]
MSNHDQTHADQSHHAINDRQRLYRLAGVLCIGGVFLTTAWMVQPHGASASSTDPFAALPDSYEVIAVVRDFKGKDEDGGHPDFESFGGTTTIGLVDEYLDTDGLPTAKNPRGKELVNEYKDKEGRNINPALYNADLGDVAGSTKPGPSSNGFQSVHSFSQWYRDVPGVNAARQVALTFHRIPNTTHYVFDSATDEPYKSLGGFFPINGQLYGNYKNTGKDFHFTTELSTQFTYVAGEEQVFKFTGDDDVWVFIGGRLVLDLGGLHPRREQVVDLSRLDWLVDGKTYDLRVFHAERHTSESNFRVETTLRLRTAELPPSAGLHD